MNKIVPDQEPGVKTSEVTHCLARYLEAGLAVFN